MVLRQRRSATSNGRARSRKQRRRLLERVYNHLFTARRVKGGTDSSSASVAAHGGGSSAAGRMVHARAALHAGACNEQKSPAMNNDGVRTAALAARRRPRRRRAAYTSPPLTSSPTYPQARGVIREALHAAWCLPARPSSSCRDDRPPRDKRAAWQQQRQAERLRGRFANVRAERTPMQSQGAAEAQPRCSRGAAEVQLRRN